ncbi:unnamed protein product [Urochloa humidicola]
MTLCTLVPRQSLGSTVSSGGCDVGPCASGTCWRARAYHRRVPAATRGWISFSCSDNCGLMHSLLWMSEYYVKKILTLSHQRVPAEDEDSAVCSYLLLLGMIVDREDVVHELRRRRILQGGGGLTNSEVLVFLTSLRLGTRYVRTMKEIENYKVKRRTRTKLHAFVYMNRKAIVTVVSAVTAVLGIIGTLKSLKVLH